MYGGERVDFLDIVILGNSLEKWAVALIVAALAYLVFRLLQEVILFRLRKTAQEDEESTESLIFDLAKSTRTWMVVTLCLYAGSLTLYLPYSLEKFLKVIAGSVALLQVALWGLHVIDYAIERRVRLEPEKADEQRTTFSAFRLIARIALCSVIALLILENATGIKVDALIAGLGIGGIAVALAVQNILGDLFSSMTIALDKPFVIGDVISVGTFTGTVEKIGLKSTRLRSIDGELLVFSNSDLLSSRIQNLGNRQRRRVVFSLGVAQESDPKTLESIPGMLCEIIEHHEHTTFGWAFIKEIANYWITFECVYFIESADFQTYISTSHAIYLEILQRFHEAGIEMPYPTQNIRITRPDEA